MLTIAWLTKLCYIDPSIIIGMDFRIRVKIVAAAISSSTI